MNRLATAGLGLIGVGLVGYAVGLGLSYPGRAFAVTAVMLGVTLLAIRRAGVAG